MTDAHLHSPHAPGARAAWVAWALLSASLLVLVAALARNVPYWDDWKLVPVLLGNRAASLPWLWEPSNEHRSPIAKLLLWALARLSGGDLRWAMGLSVLLLVGTTAMLLRGVAALTGRLRWQDIAIPLLCLNWGHEDNLLWAVELHFVLPVAAFLLALLTLLQTVRRDSSTWLFARLLVTAGLLPLQSMVGVCLAAPLAAWMLWAAPRLAGTSRGTALRSCALLMIALGGLCLATRPSSPASTGALAGAADDGLNALRVLSLSLGPAGRSLWPWSGLLAAAVGACAAGRLVRVLRREPEARPGASLLLAGLAATGGLALVIGVSRAGLGWSSGFAPRYVTLMTPWLLCSYLSFRLHGPERSGWMATAAACVGLALLLPVNTQAGLHAARERSALLDAFAADVRAGLSPGDLVAAHGTDICPNPKVLLGRLELLQHERLWLFAEAAPAPR